MSGILGTGGLPDRRPDQTRNPPLSGTQPGSSAGIVRARLIIVSGSGEGVFIYNGTPGAGNPPIFSATGGTTDPYGNTVIPTLQIQGGGRLTVGAAGAPEVELISNAAITVTTDISTTSAAASNVTSFGTLQQIITFPSNNANELSPPIIGETLVTYTNGETADGLLFLSGTTESSLTAGSFQLTLSTSSGATYPGVIICGVYKISGSAVTLVPATFQNLGDGQLGVYYVSQFGSGGKPSIPIGGLTDGNLVPSTYENWHSVAAGNSWTGTIYYKLTADNEVYLWSNNLTSPAASVNGVTIASFGSVYTPNVSMTFGVQEVQASNAGFAFRLTLSNSGNLTSTGVSASVGVCLGQRVPLDLP
jgi:hypothetical protein